MTLVSQHLQSYVVIYVSQIHRFRNSSASMALCASAFEQTTSPSYDQTSLYVSSAVPSISSSRILLKIPPKNISEVIPSPVLLKNFIHDYSQEHRQKLLKRFQIYQHFFLQKEDFSEIVSGTSPAIFIRYSSKFFTKFSEDSS